MSPLMACAEKRRRFPVGASPTRQPLQPEAIGAVTEVTKWLKPSISVSRIGDSASVHAAATTPAQRLGVASLIHPAVSAFPERVIGSACEHSGPAQSGPTDYAASAQGCPVVALGGTNSGDQVAPPNLRLIPTCADWQGINDADKVAIETRVGKVTGIARRLAPLSLSCSSPSKGRWQGLGTQHCGYCLPCLIRRAALYAGFGRGTDPTVYTLANMNARPLDTRQSEGQ